MNVRAAHGAALICLLALLAPPAGGQPEADATADAERLPSSEAQPLDLSEPRQPSSGGTARYLLQALLALLLVVGLVYGAVLLLRRLQGGAPLRGGDGAIEILDSRALGPDRAVHLVRIGSRVLLIGATGGSMAKLAELSPDDIAAQGAGSETTDGESATDADG